MADKLQVIAHLTAKPGKEEELHELLQSMIPPTRAEAGCVMYVLWRDPENPAHFAFVEEWTSEAALDEHLATPHLTDALGRFEDLLAGPPQIGRYDAVG